MVHHKYVIQKSLDLASSTGNEVVYRANNPYDPEVAIGGGQPSHWATFQALYGNWRVAGSKISVKFMPNAALDKDCIVGILVTDTGVSILSTLDRSELLQTPYNKYRYFEITQEKGPRVKNTFSAKKRFGISRIADSDDIVGNVNGPIDASAFRGAFFHMFVYTADGGVAGASSSFECHVEIEYAVIWNRPVLYDV